MNRGVTMGKLEKMEPLIQFLCKGFEVVEHVEFTVEHAKQSVYQAFSDGGASSLSALHANACFGHYVRYHCGSLPTRREDRLFVRQGTFWLPERGLWFCK